MDVNLGMGLDELSKPVRIKGMITAKGLVSREYHTESNMGAAITIKIDNKPISVVVEGESLSYTELSQFKDSNINVDEYDLFVVKQGYISPDFKSISPFCIMALTDGPTDQKTEETWSYRQIMRPMFPFDELDYRIEEKK